MKQTLAAYVVRDGAGLVTGRLIPRLSPWRHFVASGQDEASMFEALTAQIDDALALDAHVLEPFYFVEEVKTASVRVEVRPSTVVHKRAVIGKDSIPLEVTYAWSPLAAEHSERGAAGYRLMLPRLGWSFVVEELGLAADVLRQAISADLTGASARSLFDFRAVAEESVVAFRPRLRRRKRESAESVRDGFPNLVQVAEDWGALARAGRLGAHYGVADERQYSALLAADPKPSILLVGPSGVGKTEWVRELARRVGRLPQVDGMPPTRVWASSADRIIAGMQYLGMWEKRCLDLIFELSGEGHWLYVDRLGAFARPRSGASSLADLFLPALEQRRISLIAECTSEELAKLSVLAPSFVSSFQIVHLEAPAPEQVAALIAEYQERKGARLALDPDATRRLVRHLSLFRKDQAFFGKALVFLEWFEREQEQAGRARSLDIRDADRLFCRYSGLPEKLVCDDQLGDADTLAAELVSQVIGQDQACRLCARLLTRFKAGVNDPTKPIGSVLFVGPTGVGKTELAKQLARFVFGSAERLIRLDMSEYLLGGAAARLLSDEPGTDSLAQRVSRQPLSLVLLDEVEKAHPAVMDVLLGLLGEGRLTTTSGRLVDFRMTFVVMTSNLGPSATRSGFGAGDADPRDAVRAVRDHFRPEFINRLDQIVPFSALSPEALRRIVELELEAIARREGIVSRGLLLEVSARAKDRLAALGHDPKYGARPLKRVIEDRVMTPIAVELARRPHLEKLRVEVDCNGTEIEVRFGST